MRSSFLILFLLPSYLFGQFQLKGTIQDVQKEPVIGANVSLYTNDTVFYKGVSTNIDGTFIMNNLDSNQYLIEVSFTGFENYKEVIELNDTIDLPTITLLTKTEMLQSLKVKATQALVIEKGDTLEYNATAFKTNIDASSGDLINKIPGMNVENGTVTAEGEEVKKVLIDGKAYFGEDTKAALETIPADGVDKIQVLDDKTEESKRTGVEDGKVEKTINIVTKESFRNSIFGDVVAGVGPDNRYNLGGNANYFGDSRKVSVFGFSNNVNIEGGSSISSINSGWNSPAQNINGLIGWNNDGVFSYHALGINWVEIYDKGETTFSYAYLNQQQDYEKETVREYLIDTSFSYNDAEIKAKNGNGHRIKMKSKYQVSKRGNLSFENRTTLSNSISNTIFQSENKLDSNLYQSSERSLGVTYDYNIFNSVNYTHKLDTHGRSIRFYFSQTYNNANEDEDEVNQLNDPNGTTNLFYTRQRKGINENYSSNLTYSNPFFKLGTASISFGSSINNRYQQMNVTDQLSDAADRIDSLSNYGVVKEIEYSSNLNININKVEGLYLYAGISYDRVNFLYNQLTPLQQTSNLQYNNFSGNLWSSYKLSKQYKVRLSYYSYFIQPGVGQLTANINNTNLLNPTVGNPNLQQSFSNYVSGGFSRTTKDKTGTTSLRLSYSFERNDVVQVSEILTSDTSINGYAISRGSVLNTFQNMNGNFGYGMSLGHSFAWGVIKSKLNIRGSYNYNQRPLFVRGESGFNQNETFSVRLKISSNISEKIDYNVSFSPSYQIITSTINTSFNNQYIEYPINASLSYEAPKDIVLKCSYNGRVNDGYQNNINYHLLNFSIGKRVFKSKMGKIQVEVFDGLNQNNNLSVSNQPAYVEEVRTNRIQRYYMLSFTYKIRAKKSKEKNEMPEGIIIIDG